MKLARAFVLLVPLASFACGVEAAGPDPGTPGGAMQSSSGQEGEPRTIVRLQTRRGTVNIDSTRDGVRYGVDDSAGVSLERLRTDQPGLYEIVRRAAASPGGATDARIDPRLRDRAGRDGVLIGDVGE